MDDKNLNRAISETLHTVGDSLHAPAEMKMRVDFARNAAPRRKMRSWKRTAIALCAVFAVVVSGALAGGRIVSWSSHTYLDQKWSDFDRTASSVKKYVPDMKYVESFANGYAFDKGWENTTAKNDEANNTVETFTGIMLNYQKDGALVTLDVEPLQEDGTYFSPFDTVREVGGLEVHYREMHQIFLPPDGSEKPTAEEQAKFDAGEINIGYGSNQREESTFYRVCWIEDCKFYAIYTMDPESLTEDDFFQMAQEIIGA